MPLQVEHSRGRYGKRHCTNCGLPNRVSPAVVVGDHDYLREPFAPERGSPSLADLQRHSLEVCSIQNECEARYTEWHSQRLSCILAWLAGLTPVPDIVVFPECSVPIHDLHLMKAFAEEHRGTVFAGTHTLRLRPDDEQQYTRWASRRNLESPGKGSQEEACSQSSLVMRRFVT